MPAGTGEQRHLRRFTILYIKKQSVHYRILRSYKDTLHGPSDWNRTSGLLNPILSPRLFVGENKEIIQLFRAFAIFRIVFISYFPYIPLAFRLYSAFNAGENYATSRPSFTKNQVFVKGAFSYTPLSKRRAKSLLLVALLNRALMRFRLFIVVDSN